MGFLVLKQCLSQLLRQAASPHPRPKQLKKAGALPSSHALPSSKPAADLQTTSSAPGAGLSAAEAASLQKSLEVQKAKALGVKQAAAAERKAQAHARAKAKAQAQLNAEALAKAQLAAQKPWASGLAKAMGKRGFETGQQAVKAVAAAHVHPPAPAGRQQAAAAVAAAARKAQAHLRAKAAAQAQLDAEAPAKALPKQRDWTAAGASLKVAATAQPKKTRKRKQPAAAEVVGAAANVALKPGPKWAKGVQTLRSCISLASAAALAGGVVVGGGYAGATQSPAGSGSERLGREVLLGRFGGFLRGTISQSSAQGYLRAIRQILASPAAFGLEAYCQDCQRAAELKAVAAQGLGGHGPCGPPIGLQSHGLEGENAAMQPTDWHAPVLRRRRRHGGLRRLAGRPGGEWRGPRHPMQCAAGWCVCDHHRDRQLRLTGHCRRCCWRGITRRCTQ